MVYVVVICIKKLGLFMYWCSLKVYVYDFYILKIKLKKRYLIVVFGCLKKLYISSMYMYMFISVVMKNILKL